MRTSFIGLALAVACTAAPIDNIEARKAGGNTPATIQFFYDTQCTFPGSTLTMYPYNQRSGKVHGGPYGTKSAWFAAIGDLASWDIQDAIRNPKNFKSNPGIVECVSFKNGIYVDGNIDTIINTHHKE
ncbi:hypothetical protein MMC14_001780 [Varicellaria rhodocarpa]|nr:hypothetical protein [Varicellaria rhodocarpa]